MTTAPSRPAASSVATSAGGRWPAAKSLAFILGASSAFWTIIALTFVVLF